MSGERRRKKNKNDYVQEVLMFIKLDSVFTMLAVLFRVSATKGKVF